MCTRIYLTDLQSYNEGALVGKWLDLPCDNLDEELKTILKTGEKVTGTEDHEEYFVSDWESDVLDISEHADIFTLNTEAEEIESFSDEERVAIGLLIDNGIVCDLDEAIANKENIHCTGEKSMEDVAFAYVEDGGLLETMPENLRYYFDYEKMGRDMDIEGTYLEDSEGVLWEVTV